MIEKGEILNKLSYRHRLTFSGYKEANGNFYALKIVVLLPIKRKLRIEIEGKVDFLKMTENEETRILVF